MLAEEMDKFTLSRRLGHERYATTHARYSNLMPAQQLSAAEVAAAAMGGCVVGPRHAGIRRRPLRSDERP